MDDHDFHFLFEIAQNEETKKTTKQKKSCTKLLSFSFIIWPWAFEPGYSYYYHQQIIVNFIVTKQNNVA